MHYDLPTLICAVLAFVPALVLHEAAHALAAYKLGDPTAKSRGRLSLNDRIDEASAAFCRHVLGEEEYMPFRRTAWGTA